MPRGHHGAHLGTTTKAGSQANRNAGFIRQAGEWHWGCRINPAFRWWCQDAPGIVEEWFRSHECRAEKKIILAGARTACRWVRRVQSQQ